MKYIYPLIFFFLITQILVAQQAEGSGLTTETSQTEALDPNLQGKLDLGQIDPSVPLSVNNQLINFFNTLISGDYEKAYKDLLSNSPIGTNEEKIALQIKKTKEAVELYGKILSFESAGSDYESRSYLTVKFFTLHPFNPLHWTFTFYHSPTLGWLVLNLKLTDKLE